MSLSKMKEKESDTINNLKIYKELSSNAKDHIKLLKDRKVILYAAMLLEKRNIDILKLCLDIFENFINNEETHSTLLSTFGVYEALEALAIRIRAKDEKLYNRAKEITDILRNNAPPSFNTRSKKYTKNSEMYLLYIDKLNKKNRINVENVLLKIRGVVSFLIDIDLKRCTLRICPKVTIDQVVQKIGDNCKLKCLVVTKKDGVENLCDLTEAKKVSKSYLEYLEEDVISPKAQAISATTKNILKNGNSLLNSVVSFWNESFYW